MKTTFRKTSQEIGPDGKSFRAYNPHATVETLTCSEYNALNRFLNRRYADVYADEDNNEIMVTSLGIRTDYDDFVTGFRANMRAFRAEQKKQR